MCVWEWVCISVCFSSETGRKRLRPCCCLGRGSEVSCTDKDTELLCNEVMANYWSRYVFGWILLVATLKSVTEMSMFSGTGQTTIPLYGFLIPGCQLCSCTTNNPVRHAHVSVCHTCLWFLCVYLGAHAPVPPGPYHPQLVWLPVRAHKLCSTCWAATEEEALSWRNLKSKQSGYYVSDQEKSGGSAAG